MSIRPFNQSHFQPQISCKKGGFSIRNPFLVFLEGVNCFFEVPSRIELLYTVLQTVA